MLLKKSDDSTLQPGWFLNQCDFAGFYPFFIARQSVPFATLMLL
jgi:hypothetical protein